MNLQFNGTPGKWFAVQFGPYWNILDSPYYDGKNLLDEESDDRSAANAKCAASSPELLKALQELILDISNKPNSSRYDTHVNKAKAAIAKATTIV